jgi:hypothetical protein
VETVAPPEFPEDVPRDALQVTPEGTGETLTLDEALQQAKRGQTIALASGDYPVSKTAQEKYNSTAYQVETPNLVLIGNRAQLPNLTIRADDVTCRGLGFDNISIGAWSADGSEKSYAKNTTIESCRFKLLTTIDETEISLSNCVGAVHIHDRSEATIDHCTLVSNDSDSFLGQQVWSGSSCRIENSILAGNPYAIQVYGQGAEDCTIRKSVVYAPRGLVGLQGPPASPGDPPTVVNVDPRDAQRQYNIRFSNCIEDDPDFLDLGGGDYRLAPSSPAKGNDDQGRDLGAHLDADGWPVSL